MANFSLLAILCIVDLIREVLCNALKLLALLILLSKHVDKLVCVDILVHLKFLDLVLEFLQTLSLVVLVLVESLAISLNLFHLFLELLNDLLCG